MYVWTRSTLYMDSCRLLDLPVESALSVSYRAGLMGMGPLYKIKMVVTTSKGDWDGLTVSRLQIAITYLKVVISTQDDVWFIIVGMGVMSYAGASH